MSTIFLADQTFRRYLRCLALGALVVWEVLDCRKTQYARITGLDVSQAQHIKTYTWALKCKRMYFLKCNWELDHYLVQYL